MTYNDLLRKMEIPLSDSDILNMIPNLKLIMYEDLDKYENIQQLLPKKIDYVVIFVKVKYMNSGHWICLLRQNKHITFFDSYGYRVDKQLLWSPKSVRKVLHQTIPYLSYLLNLALEDGFKVTFNTIEYQDKSPSIATCGRHVVNRILYLLKHPKSTSYDYYHHMEELKKKYEMTYDMIVSM